MTDQWQPPDAPSPAMEQPAAPAVGRSRLSPLAIGTSVFVLLIVAGMSFVLGRSTAPSAAHPAPTKAGPAAASTNTPKTFDLMGTLDLTTTSLSIDDTDSSCYGTGGYNDIVDGAQVVVSDGGGQTLAIGQLGAGTSTTSSCEFSVAVPNVPSGKQFYKIEVTHRGEVQYTEQQMRDGPTLSLGS